MLIETQSRQFRGDIDLADLIHRKTLIKRYQHRNKAPHDDRITVANESQSAIFNGHMQPHLRRTALNLCRWHFESLWHIRQSFAQLNHMTIAFLPIVEKFESFN